MTDIVTAAASRRHVGARDRRRNSTRGSGVPAAEENRGARQTAYEEIHRRAPACVGLEVIPRALEAVEQGSPARVEVQRGVEPKLIESVHQGRVGGDGDGRVEVAEVIGETADERDAYTRKQLRLDFRTDAGAGADGAILLRQITDVWELHGFRVLGVPVALFLFC